jgi:hypothetical protein
MAKSTKTLYGKVLSKFEDAVNAATPSPATASPEVGNGSLAARIDRGQPFFAGRLGTTENNTLSWYAKFNRPLGLPFAKDLREGSWQASGLFPPRSATLRRWSELCVEALSMTDVYCSWNLSMDGYFKAHQLKNAEFVHLGSLDAFSFPKPWTLSLAGKRVLVVHPFAETIEQQYRTKRHQIFPGREVLPEFDLATVKTPQTLAGNTCGYKDWFEAFDETRSKIDSKDFDIALVGAGSYGMPLSAHVRKRGKSVIYVGGVLQVFFGIRGGRWDNSGLYNDAWVRPLDQDRPTNFRVVEQGCYW